MVCLAFPLSTDMGGGGVMMAKEGNFLSQVFIMLLIKHGNTVRINKLETDFGNGLI